MERRMQARPMTLRDQVCQLLNDEQYGIIDVLPVSIMMVDRHHRYSYINRAERALWGAEENLAGVPMGDVIGGERYDYLKPALDDAFHGYVIEQSFMNDGIDLPSLHGDWLATHIPLWSPGRHISGVVSCFIWRRCLPESERPRLYVDTISRRLKHTAHMPAQ